MSDNNQLPLDEITQRLSTNINSSINGNLSSSSASALNSESHIKRLQESRIRQVKLDEESSQLYMYLCRNSNNILQSVDSVDDLAQYDYQLINAVEEDDYTIVSQGNLPSFSVMYKTKYISNHRRLYCRKWNLAPLTTEQVSHCIESLIIYKYFSTKCFFIDHTSARAVNEYFVKVLDIFKTPNSLVYTFVERFTPGDSLQHRIWSGNVTIKLVKECIPQLISALDTLNIAGVAHRFVRPENVLLCHTALRDEIQQIKLTAFDMACRFWDAQDRCWITCQYRALPIEVPTHLLDHLPPECFDDDYDCSMIDTWSVGVLICQLLVGSHPFVAPINDNNNNKSDSNIGTSDSQQQATAPSQQQFATLSIMENQFIKQWKQSPERREVSEEFRSLLDDIFKVANARMPLYDLMNDVRLHCVNATAFMKMKLPTYYRIDTAKNINVEIEYDLAQSIQLTKPPIERVSPNTYLPESKDIFLMKSYESVFSNDCGGGNDGCNGEHSIQGYQILREQSFGEDLCKNVITNDYYLKAIKQLSNNNNNDADTGAGGGVDDLEQNCLVKIIQINRIPKRHRNMFLTESCKIMCYFSRPEMTISANVHRVLDIVLLNQRSLYLFFENLTQYRSIRQIILQQFPPVSNVKPQQPGGGGGGTMVDSITTQYSTQKVIEWISQLAEVANCLASYGIVHRYIRPEYVFVEEQHYTKVKLSHFDLSCFAWNPTDLKRTKRTRGLQDEMEHIWDHLPPECFDNRYDPLGVDVWSLGVLLVYCVTNGEQPFVVPMNETQAMEQWRTFSNSNVHLNSLTPYRDVLQQIFVNQTERITASNLSHLLLLFRRKKTPKSSPFRTKSNPKLNVAQQQHSPKINLQQTTTTTTTMTTLPSSDQHSGQQSKLSPIDQHQHNNVSNSNNKTPRTIRQDSLGKFMLKVKSRVKVGLSKLRSSTFNSISTNKSSCAITGKVKEEKSSNTC